MNKLQGKIAALLIIVFGCLLGNAVYAQMVKGIYIGQETLENTEQINYLIKRAKKVGIQTFVVDMELASKRYEKNIQLLKQNGIAYVARVTIFPNNGGKPEQVRSKEYWDKKYRLIELAVGYGAEQIQLDYIRYSSKQPPSDQNAKDILKIIQYFRSRVKVPLQIDIFGISSFGPSRYIGQDVKLFANSVDIVCPMVYPSHYEPFKEHAVTPFDTVYNSLTALKKQFGSQALPFKLIPYIEQSNYRFPLSREKKMSYLYAQIQAAEKANADGWYVWSPHNYYDTLFDVLETKAVK